MATKHTTRINRKITVIGKEALDASKEIVIDAMYMTTDLLHAIRNNLPIELSSAQLVEDRRSEGSAPKRIYARRGLAFVGGLVALVLVAGAIGGYVYTQNMQEREAAVQASHAALWGALAPIDVNSKEFREESAVFLDANVEPAGVLTYLDKAKSIGPLTVMEREIYLSNVAETKDHARMRELSLELLKDAPENEIAMSNYTQSFVLDPVFSPELQKLSAKDVELKQPDPEKFEFEVTIAGKTWSWIPSTDDAPDDWQTPVAAYRLCRVIACEFGVREARAVSIKWQEVADLFPGQPEMLEKFNALATKDGEVVQGALVTNKEHFSKFPIERYRAWRRLLDADKELKEMPVTKALTRLKKRDPAVHHNLSRRLKGTDSVGLARQLSSMMVFDYLAGNYRRFARKSAEYGETVSMRDGQLWTEQAVGVFGTRESKRVKGRMRWVERFSQSNVTAVKAADFNVLGPHIFPGKTADEDSQVRLLDRQAEKLSDRVDAMLNKHGKEIML